MRYIIITPAKNEENYIEYTINSVISQTLLPIEWIIVDDGSNDNTINIIKNYTLRYKWIKLVEIKNQNEQKLYGSKVIRAFYEGYKLVFEKDFDFIVKLDADLTLPINYFDEISKSFKNNKFLGICGGYIIEKENDFEKKINSITYVQGAIKSVRKECFDIIGGFKPINGWDGIDQLTAMYKGWQIENIPLKVFHHRPETNDYRSLKFFFNNGIAHFQLGADLLITFIRFLTKIKEKPILIASISYFCGYLYSYLSFKEKYVDKDLEKFIRKYNYNRIIPF